MSKVRGWRFGLDHVINDAQDKSVGDPELKSFDRLSQCGVVSILQQRRGARIYGIGAWYRAAGGSYQHRNRAESLTGL